MSDLPPTHAYTPGDDYDDDALSRARAAMNAMPDYVGRYRILEHIGTGGMGEVYVAEQTTPIHRRVALKLIKAGMDTRQVIARFEAERQALAMMDHPNIARVFDAGTTDAGRPYFVMELVRGVPITEFCDAQKLTTRQRIELMIPVCQAVQHAHQKGIIHRDLKPTNVLVTLHDGVPVPKVIDFGIAKATAGSLTDKTLYTDFRQMIGTPAYMSPEQAEMSGLDIDTRSDVYSLGVLAYELLTGNTPFDTKRLVAAGIAEIGRIIKEEDPPIPSARLSTLGERLTTVATQRGTEAGRIGKLVAGELDWIVMKAMEKDRRRRYDTPTGLVEDIQRYLNGSPVHAAPPSWGYRTRKFSWKYRKGLITLGACVLMLIAGMIGTTWQWRVARRNAAEAMAQKAVAERRQQESAAIVDFLNTDVFANATPEKIPDIKIRDEIVGKMLWPAKEKVVGKFPDQPNVQAAVMTQIARSLAAVGHDGLAEPIYKDALVLRRKHLGDDAPETIDLLRLLAISARNAGHLDVAEPAAKESADRARRVLPANSRLLLSSISIYGGILHDRGRNDEFGLLQKEVLDRTRVAFGDNDIATASAMHNYGLYLWSTGKNEEAAALMKDAVARYRLADADDEDRNLVTVLLNYSSVLGELDRFNEAEPLIKEAIQRRERLYGPDHMITDGARAYLLSGLRRAGRFAEAMAIVEQPLKEGRAVPSEDPPTALRHKLSYCDLLTFCGRYDEAEAGFAATESDFRRVYANDPRALVSYELGHGRALRFLSRNAQAEPLLQSALARATATLPPDDALQAEIRWNLALVLEAQDNPEAVAMLADAIAGALKRPVHAELTPAKVMQAHQASRKAAGQGS